MSETKSITLFIVILGITAISGAIGIFWAERVPEATDFEGLAIFLLISGVSCIWAFCTGVLNHMLMDETEEKVQLLREALKFYAEDDADAEYSGVLRSIHDRPAAKVLEETKR